MSIPASRVPHRTRPERRQPSRLTFRRKHHGTRPLPGMAPVSPTPTPEVSAGAGCFPRPSYRLCETTSHQRSISAGQARTSHSRSRGVLHEAWLVTTFIFQRPVSAWHLHQGHGAERRKPGSMDLSKCAFSRRLLHPAVATNPRISPPSPSALLEPTIVPTPSAISRALSLHLQPLTQPEDLVALSKVTQQRAETGRRSAEGKNITL